MGLFLVILAALVAASGLGAMLLRDPVHCALSWVVALAGLAVLFLHLGAQFVGLAQLLVYVGAVAILIVFALLLTRSSESAAPAAVLSSSWWFGAGVAGLVFLSLAGAILSSPSVCREAPAQSAGTVRQLGRVLMETHVLPLEVVGLLLTAALVGAALIALQEKGKK